jgi:hypothetical protein
VHSIDDDITRPIGAVITERLVDSVVKHGGKAHKSIYNKFKHAPATADFWPALGNPYGWKPASLGNLVAGSQYVQMSMYQWQLMNSRNRPYTPPTKPWDGVILPKPVFVPAPSPVIQLPKVKLRILIYDNDSVSVEKVAA